MNNAVPLLLIASLALLTFGLVFEQYWCVPVALVLQGVAAVLTAVLVWQERT